MAVIANAAYKAKMINHPLFLTGTPESGLSVCDTSLFPIDLNENPIFFHHKMSADNAQQTDCTRPCCTLIVRHKQPTLYF